MNEVHGPGFVGPDRRTAVIPELRLHPPLRHLVPQLKAQLLVKLVDPLGVDLPALASQQYMDTAVAVAHARHGNLLDALSLSEGIDL